ncbi:MAG: HTTM domain-containing protein [Bdellovibrionales bacterium]|nr:HTTM domain-containing protein [Bdellovibrionales bacterium]
MSGIGTRAVRLAMGFDRTLADRCAKDARDACAAWKAFWYGSQDPMPLAAFRLVFGLSAFIFYAVRMTDYSFYFGSEGIVPYELLHVIVPASFQSVVPWEWLASDDRVGFALHGLLLSGLLTLALGWTGRWVAAFAFMLHMVFMRRNPLIIYGPDMVGTAWLLCLALSDTRNTLRAPLPGLIEAKGWRGRPPSASESSPWNTLALRLAQIQLCVVYVYGGVEKFRGQTWWQGDAIWNTLANGQLVDVNLEFIAWVPGLVALISYGVVYWETFFVALVWPLRIRPYVLAFGVALHLGIGLTMNIPYFSLFMIVSYFTFVPAAPLRAFLGLVGKGGPRRG